MRVWLLLGMLCGTLTSLAQDAPSMQNLQKGLDTVADTQAVAADFRYRTADGREEWLYQTATDRMTLLFFYDPDCDDCHYMMFRLSHSAVVNAAVSDGRLTVLAVYAEGDTARWQASLGEMPATWVVAMDRSHVKEGTSYDLSGLPMLYLLDRRKKMVLYDPDFYELTRFLNQQ